MKKILTVLGARPQFIKASVVSKAIHHANIHETVVHTGQHFDANMSDVFFLELGMTPPAYHLNIHGGSHGEMTGRMLIEVERIMKEVKPDIVLVYGDTNSTLAGALAAAKLHIPIAHVEAGLRSFNMRMPEEINRILTDRVSGWLFTPTESARNHLLREGFDDSSIITVGDVMYDVALCHGPKSDDASKILMKLGLMRGEYALATVHRAENTDDLERLSAVVGALRILADTLPVVWPLHPRTRDILARHPALQEQASQLRLIDPVGYLDIVQLERGAALIATDSGGVQKEAFFHRIPCVTLRDETEWIELVEAGWNRLAPPTTADEVASVLKASLGSSGLEVHPYGQGDAAKKIVQCLQEKSN
jgi:UDP-GlcNAc3NAcA epimerase